MLYDKLPKEFQSSLRRSVVLNKRLRIEVAAFYKLGYRAPYLRSYPTNEPSKHKALTINEPTC